MAESALTGNQASPGRPPLILTDTVQKFPLGGIYATPGVQESIPNSTLAKALARHAAGDWGDLDAEDKAENELSLKNGFRLLSAYHSEAGVKFWVITEADRSVTTALLPSEY
jgi:hypothetical protein